ncbi:MAG: helix-turn-helix domain-containing protein [Saccharofermentanales bacterium]|jgi:transcriptional regulator with XRE-family HTH domain
MNSQGTVAKRIEQLCNMKGIAVSSLATLSKVPASTIYSILNNKSKNPGTESIRRLCVGLDITLRQFFDCDLFDS